MKKRVTTFIAAVFTVVLAFTFFTIPVSADSGPKEHLILTIDDPPDEEYYIDLLYQYRYEIIGDGSVEKYIKNGDDPEMVELLFSVKETQEGNAVYRLFNADKGFPLDKSFGKNDKNQYEYVPSADMPGLSEFKIVIVTKSKKLIISDTIHKTAFFSEITYNFETKKWYESHSADIQNLMKVFAHTLTATLLIEGILLIFFLVGETKNKRTIGKIS